MFRTSPVCHQERFVEAVFADFDMRITTYHSLQIQLLQNATDDRPVSSETCRAKLKC